MLVIQSEDLEPGPATWLGERCELVRCARTDAGFDELLARASGLVVRTYTRVDDALLDKAPGLKVVARAGVALENIDVQACRARGVEVVHTPDANTRAVIEFVWSMIMSRLRPFRPMAGAVDVPRWHQIRAEDVLDKQLCELTLGIYGLGRIGKGMARVGAAMNMRVVYCDVLDIPKADRHGAEPVSRETLLAEADILSIHVDSRASNRGLIGTDAARQLKSSVLLINSSRGFVIDTNALATFLRAHPSAHAMLDVHEPEPPPPDYPLWGLANATLTPHEAAATALARENMSWVVRDVWRVLQGETPAHPAPELI